MIGLYVFDALVLGNHLLLVDDTVGGGIREEWLV